MAISEAQRAELLDRIATGESLRSICRSKHMPGKSEVFRVLAVDEVLRDQYARAREQQADAIFDEILDIADQSTPETVQQARLQIDARKWMAGKLRPKKYGDKLELSGDPGAPIKHEISADEAFARLASRLAGAATGSAGGVDSAE